MKSAIRNIAVASSLAISTLAIAQFSGNGNELSLAPMQAHTISMQDYTAVVYYTVSEKGAYEVTTTIGPNIDINGRASQHKVTLSEGQSWSLDLADGETVQQISFTAEDDELQLVSL